MTNLEADLPLQNDGNVLFSNTMFEEVMDLLLESHEYFDFYGERDHDGTTPAYKMLYSSELSRITLRLTSMMAWLMVRKAVFSGQISYEEAAEKYRLEARNEGLFRCEDAMQYLPTYMAHLLDHSHRLFTRISRLDDIVYTDTENVQPELFGSLH